MTDMPVGERKQLAPPVDESGPFGWARKHLFSSWANGITTVVLIGAMAWILSWFLEWAVFTANFTASTGSECRGGGACWALIREKWRLIFFGTFAISAFLGMPSIDRKLAARSPEAAAKLRAETSILPFGAILAGRNRLVLGEIGWLAPVLALIGWAVVLHFHARFFGVPALLPF